MSQAEGSDISRLRRMKGSSRIWLSNYVSDLLLSIDYADYPGLYHEFLESRPYETDKGSWIEHKWLVRAIKEGFGEEWFGKIFKTLGKLLSHLSLTRLWREQVDVVGLEEVQTDDPSHYYFLVGIISNGKDKEEKENSSTSIF